MVWSCKTSPKLQLFLWKVVQGAVALGENLARRGLLSNTTCRYCGDFESTEHIFLHCSVTRQVWDSSLWSTDFKPSDCTTFSEALLANHASEYYLKSHPICERVEPGAVKYLPSTIPSPS
ncbi:hypothetical protein Bca52824_021820 [Brassica carinata]|uniref:Reverse transcriptase zinc-binding domain-containing protein n=1 Tax=Brassica carinata TaxID=52824 RepID=A0A8X7VF05_BRACI|nr:hypothetical protein Bca52824_021820 [Brassica carinata]